MLDHPLHLCIISGKILAGLPPEDIGPGSCYSLWHVREGHCRVVETPSKPRGSVHHPGSVLLLAPGAMVHIGRKARVARLLFTLQYHRRLKRHTITAIKRGITFPPPEQLSWKELIGTDLPAVIDREQRTSAASLVDRCCDRHWRSNGDLREAEAELQLWLIRIIRSQVEDTLSTQDGFVTQVEQMMRARLAECLTVEDIGRSFAMHRQQFITAFSRDAGLPPGERLLQIRMQRSRTLLATTELPIAEVANLAGYRTPSAFSRAFLREHGISPSHYRQQ